MLEHLLTAMANVRRGQRSKNTEATFLCILASVSEPTILAKQPPLVGKVSAIFVDRGCHVVSVRDPNGHVLSFLDHSHYYFFHVAPQL
jgi:hypothetical protein